MAGGVSSRVDRGTWLVLAQAGCLVVVWLWPAPPLWPLPTWVEVAGRALIVLALVLGLAGVWHLGRYLRIHPRPADRAELATTGVYRLVRHPIYAAVLIGSAAESVLAARIEPLLGFIGLAIVLHLKAGYEESLLRAHFGEAYDTYASRVPRLVPFSRF
jgi:protein-S-isoprenylcysteine O-methyltransferase Ste14